MKGEKMQEFIESKDWSNHPFLSKLTIRSDYDGDPAFTIKNPTPEDYVEAKKVTLEYSVNGGDWKLAAFTDTTPFIDEMSMGWYFNPSFHPLLELHPDYKGENKLAWRARISNQ